MDKIVWKNMCNTELQVNNHLIVPGNFDSNSYSLFPIIHIPFTQLIN